MTFQTYPYIEPNFHVPQFTCQFQKIYDLIQQQFQKRLLFAKKLQISEHCPHNLLDSFVKRTHVDQTGLLLSSALPPVRVPTKRRNNQGPKKIDITRRRCKQRFEYEEMNASICSSCGSQRIHDQQHASFVCENSTCPKVGIVINAPLSCQGFQGREKVHTGSWKRSQQSSSSMNNDDDDGGGQQQQHMLGNSSTSSMSTSGYKKLSHLRDVLQCAQGKETKQIEMYVYEKLFEYCEQHRIYDRTVLSPECIEKILKKYKLVKWYIHHVKIHWEFTGIRPHQLTDEEEEEIYQDFHIIEQHFDTIKGIRSSMINYKYVPYKSCERRAVEYRLANFPELSQRWNKNKEAFGLLKNDNKVRELDDIYLKICERVGWLFIPTKMF